jgi:hypothetical protein
MLEMKMRSNTERLTTVHFGTQCLTPPRPMSKDNHISHLHPWRPDLEMPADSDSAERARPAAVAVAKVPPSSGAEPVPPHRR